jgi:hypothetical protein
MVPIYSILSCLSFRFAWRAQYYDVLRDGYEGMVLYSFFSLMLHYLGDSFLQQHQRLEHLPDKRLTVPLCCWKINPRGFGFLINTKILVLQYAVVRVTTTIAGIIMAHFGVLCPESMSPRRGQFWLILVNATSASIAMYALILFYEIIHSEIKQHNPLRKLLAVKFVVFFCFWQALALSIMMRLGWFNGTLGYSTPEGMISSLQSLLVCVEMVMASCLHKWAFGWKEHSMAVESRVERWNQAHIETSVMYSSHAPIASLRAKSQTRIEHSTMHNLVDALNPMEVLDDVRNTPQNVEDLVKYRRDKKLKRQIKDIDETFESDLPPLPCNKPEPLITLLDDDLKELGI